MSKMIWVGSRKSQNPQPEKQRLRHPAFGAAGRSIVVVVSEESGRREKAGKHLIDEN
jgi:hypothetical protein